MSTYAVFGMTKHRAILEARDKIPTHDKLGMPIDEAEWIAAVEKRATETMAGTRCIQLSEKFDAPQFAREFLELARKLGNCRSLHIKSYAKTDARSPKTGKPIYEWADVV